MVLQKYKIDVNIIGSSIYCIIFGPFQQTINVERLILITTFFKSS